MNELRPVDQLKELSKGPIPQELAFPESEYMTRVAKVKKAMDAQGVDVLLVSHLPNLCYLTGYQFTNCDYCSYLILPRDGEAVMVVPGTEVPAVLLHGWVRNVLAFPSWKSYEAPPKIAQVFKDQGLAEKNIGVELQHALLDPFTYEQVREQLPHANFSDTSDLITGLRAIKSTAEIAHLRQAARFTDLGMQAALAEIRPGKLDNDVAASALDAMIRTGSEFFSIAPFVAVGHRSGLQYTTFGRIPIKKGDTVLVELAGVYHRYSAPLVRTAVIGPPSDVVRRLAEVSLRCLNTLLKTVQPGTPMGEAARKVKSILEPMEDEIWPLRSFGYTVGVGLPPTWVEDTLQIQEGNERCFEPGMVFHSPLGIRLPGQLGVSFSECWLVTEKGVEVLSKINRELYLIPG